MRSPEHPGVKIWNLALGDEASITCNTAGMNQIISVVSFQYTTLNSPSALSHEVGTAELSRKTSRTTVLVGMSE